MMEAYQHSFQVPNYSPDFPSSPAHDPGGVGSLQHDLNIVGYNKCWSSLSDFRTWLSAEQAGNGIEYLKTRTDTDHRSPPQFSQKAIYVCSRRGSGGSAFSYVPTREAKHCGCPSRLTVKTYPGMDIVLGLYRPDHTHPIGRKNLRWTRLPKETKQKIEMMLRLGMNTTKILQALHALDGDTEDPTRENMATPDDVRRIQRMIDEEISRFARADIDSVRVWVEMLEREGHFVLLKCSGEHRAGFDDDAFVLIVQMKYQRECWLKFGHRFAGLDATHNTTFYQSTSLFTLMARDDWGHGMPSAWMISSNACQTTIEAFLREVRKTSPAIEPACFMSDKDRAQMNAITTVFPATILYLCWWHVLRAWWQTFNTTAHADLWALMRRWIRMTSIAEFDATWAKIQATAPASVVEFLRVNWMGEKELWSAVYRTDRNVYQLCDTNMLAEAWHRFLKHHIMAGKHGRRLDQLLHLLIRIAIPYFAHRHLRQSLGFSGKNVAQRELDDVVARGAAIKKTDITSVPAEDGDLYDVRSQTSPEKTYRVHLGTPAHCSCPAFPHILYCKHLHAAAGFFAPELVRTSPLLLEIEPTEYADPDGDDDGSDRPRSPQTTLPPPTPTTAPSPDHLLREEVKAGLAWLSCRLQSDPRTPSDALAGLADAIRLAKGRFQQYDNEENRKQDPLPPKVVVAPHQHHETLTAAAMGQPRKGADKRRANAEERKAARQTGQPRPFRAGESSGKKAKADALRHPASDDGDSFKPSSVDISEPTLVRGLKKQHLELLLAWHSLKNASNNTARAERLIEHAAHCKCQPEHAQASATIQSAAPAYSAQTAFPTLTSFTFRYPPVPAPLPTAPAGLLQGHSHIQPSTVHTYSLQPQPYHYTTYHYTNQ